MIGIGPGNWLYTDEDANGGDDDAAVAMLCERLAGVASVFDQSSGYGVLRIEGSAAAALIGKGAFIDLHPAAFPLGSSAVTVIAHIDAILWRLDEDVFEIAIFRSFAGSFWHWLATAAAAMGIAPSRPDPFQHSGDENARG
jgi:sarcosine oxidase subunit gamma